MMRLNMNNNRILLTLGIVFAMCIFANSVFAENTVIKAGVEKDGFTLENCIEMAVENNPKIKASLSQTRAAEAQIGQTKSTYFPRLSASTGIRRINNTVDNSIPDNSRNNFNAATISLNQQLYDFGKTKLSTNIKTLNFDYSNEDLRNVTREVKYNVKTAYYYLLYTLLERDVVQNSVNLYEEQLKRAKAFYAIGTKPKIDITIADVNLSSSKFDLIKAQNDVKVAYAQLNNAIGVPEQTDFLLKDKLTFPKYNITFDKLMDIAYKSRNDLKKAKLSSEISAKKINLAKKDYMPTLYSVNSYNLGGRTYAQDNGWSAGIALDLPFTNNYLIRKNIEEAKANLDVNVYNESNIRNDAYLQVKKAYIDYYQLTTQIPVAEVSLRQARENFYLSKGRYNAGLANPIELKEAEVAYRSARLDYFKTLYDYNKAIATIENVINAELGQEFAEKI